MDDLDDMEELVCTQAEIIARALYKAKQSIHTRTIPLMITITIQACRLNDNITDPPPGCRLHKYCHLRTILESPINPSCMCQVWEETGVPGENPLRQTTTVKKKKVLILFCFFITQACSGWAKCPIIHRAQHSPCTVSCNALGLKVLFFLFHHLSALSSTHLTWDLSSGQPLNQPSLSPSLSRPVSRSSYALALNNQLYRIIK